MRVTWTPFPDHYFSNATLDTTSKILDTVLELPKGCVSSFELYGYNERIFSSGGDLFLVSQASKSVLQAYATRCVRAILSLRAIRMQGIDTVAVVRGKALGGGAEAALMCKTVVLQPGASLEFPEYLHGDGLFPFCGGEQLAKNAGLQVNRETGMVIKNYTAHQQMIDNTDAPTQLRPSYLHGLADRWVEAMDRLLRTDGARIDRLAKVQRGFK